MVDEPLAPPTMDDATDLLDLIDRLGGVLERSGLSEIEIGAGETTLVVRSAAALYAVAPGEPPAASQPAVPEAVPVAPADEHHAVVAPLTGIFYSAPTPDAAPYVRVGAQVVVGQVIGLIEAMKLFNEIKADAAGRVVRLVAENGKLVKAKQPLIEVDAT